jgi:hypothetical protein
MVRHSKGYRNESRLSGVIHRRSIAVCLARARGQRQEEIPFVEQIVSAESFNLMRIKELAVRWYNQSTQFHYLKSGPEERGNPRKYYAIKGQDKGDVYNFLVRVMALDPPFVQLSSDAMKSRMESISDDDEEPNIRGALNQIEKAFKDGESRPPIEWDDNKKLLSIVDPHFYFYLRCQLPQSP